MLGFLLIMHQMFLLSTRLSRQYRLLYLQFFIFINLKRFFFHPRHTSFLALLDAEYYVKWYHKKYLSRLRLFYARNHRIIMVDSLTAFCAALREGCTQCVDVHLVGCCTAVFCKSIVLRIVAPYVWFVLRWYQWSAGILLIQC